MSSQLVPAPASLPSLIVQFQPCEILLPLLREMHSFSETRCTKYHEQYLYRGRVWVSVVLSLVNTHGDFVSCLISLWCLLFHSISAILASCSCPLFVALHLSFQFTSVQALSPRPITFSLPKKTTSVLVAFRVCFSEVTVFLWQSSYTSFREVEIWLDSVSMESVYLNFLNCSENFSSYHYIPSVEVDLKHFVI